MKVIGVLSRKGGVGKTTLAIHLAVLAQQAGLRTLLVDLGPQGSAVAWWRAREAETPQVTVTTPPELVGILDAAKASAVDLVVIDARPGVEADALHVATLADLVLIPTRPAIFDLRAILGTLDIVKGTARRALIVLNACPPPRGAGEASIVTDARRALTRRAGCDHQPRRLRLGRGVRPDGRRGRTGQQGSKRDARVVARCGKGVEL